MDDRSFADLLATIWERHGWTTEVTARDGDYLVAGERADGRRGLILVSPGADPVSSGPIEELRNLAGEKGIDVAVAATRSSFESEAKEIADSADLHLLDPETLEQTAEAKGFEDLLQQYTATSGGGLAGILPSLSLPSLGGPNLDLPHWGLYAGLRSGLSKGNGQLLLAAGVVVLVLSGWFFGLGDLLGGLLAGLPIPDLGLFDAIGGLLSALPIPDLGLFDAIGGLLSGLPGLGSGGESFSVTAVSLADAEGDPITVSWDVTRGKSVTGPNGTTYDAAAVSENTTFVVVSINASNPTAETVIIEEENLGFAVEGERYGPQPLDGAEGQLPLVVPPATTAEGYVAFAVPESAEEGTLLGLPGPEALPLRFERDSEVEAPVTVS